MWRPRTWVSPGMAIRSARPVPVLPPGRPRRLQAIHQHLKSTDAEGHLEEVAEILLPQFAEMRAPPGR